MTEALNRLIAALREELQQYGEMLALLDRQQDMVVARATEDLFQSIAAIQNQAALIHSARSHRDHCRNAVATAVGRPPDVAFSDLIPELPPNYRPLVDALVTENNQLLGRVQQRARQNHLLLTRSLELMQRLLSTLLPSRDPLVYDGHGGRPAGPLPAAPLYEAVG
jgi:hypothetical protein